MPDAPAPQSAPPLSDYLRQLPPELRRALVDYVLGEWLSEIGQVERGQQRLQRAYATMDSYTSEPRAPSTAERSYNPLGL